MRFYLMARSQGQCAP